MKDRVENDLVRITAENAETAYDLDAVINKLKERIAELKENYARETKIRLKYKYQVELKAYAESLKIVISARKGKVSSCQRKTTQ